MLQTQTYAYDGNGNLTQANDPDGNYAIAYDKLNRAEVVSGPFGVTQTFGYDAAGNRTTVSDNRDGSGSSTYDLATHRKGVGYIFIIEISTAKSSFNPLIFSSLKNENVPDPFS